MALVKTIEEKKLEKDYEDLACWVVNVKASIANAIRKAEEIETNPACATHPDFTAEHAQKVADVKSAMLSMVIPNYDYLKDPAKMPKDKAK